MNTIIAIDEYIRLLLLRFNIKNLKLFLKIKNFFLFLYIHIMRAYLNKFKEQRKVEIKKQETAKRLLQIEEELNAPTSSMPQQQ